MKRPKRYSDGQLTYGPWYIDDWIASPSVLGLSDAGYRLYHLICLRVMQRGPMPDDPAYVRAVCPGVRDFDAAWAEVRPALLVDAAGRLYQRRAMAEHEHGIAVCREATAAVWVRDNGPDPGSIDTSSDRSIDTSIDVSNGVSTQTQTQTENLVESTDGSSGGGRGAQPPHVGATGADALGTDGRAAANGHAGPAPRDPSEGSSAGRDAPTPREAGGRGPDPAAGRPRQRVPRADAGGRLPGPADPAGPQTGPQAADVGRVCRAVERLVEVRHGSGGGKARRASRQARSAGWTKAAGLLLRLGPPGERAPVPVHEVVEVCRWLAQEAPSRGGFCWGEVIETPAKLRERWVDVVAERDRAAARPAGTNGHADSPASAAWRALTARLTSGEMYSEATFTPPTLAAAKSIGGLTRVYSAATTGTEFDLRDLRREFVAAYTHTETT